MGRILVVDDNPSLVTLLLYFMRLNGHEVDEAVDGRMALDRLGQGQYAVVLLDLNVPGLAGVPLLEAILEVDPEVRVVVVSANLDVETRISCLRAGASDFLVKPFDVGELAARVDVLLDGAPRKAFRGGSTVSGVSLDRVRRVAHTPAGSVQLSGREFLLLERLISNVGEVCSRQELLADIWGYSFETVTNVADVYIRRLRAKLPSITIETVRSVGYRLLSDLPDPSP